MMTKIEVLDKNAHESLRLSKISSFEFAAKTSAVAISFSEMPRSSACYPIVFPETGDSSPRVVLSVVNDTNAYVDSKGNWKASYIPSHFRLYPFVLGKIDQKNENQDPGEKKVALCIDRDAPHFASNMGEPLFTANGEPLEFVLTIFESLKKRYQELEVTRQLFHRVAETGILQPRELHTQIKNGKKIVQKFRIVDMEKLKELDDKILAEWSRTGVMAYIYDHVRSLAHFVSKNKNVEIKLV